MNDLMIQANGALTISDIDRIRIAAAWEALLVNSRWSYRRVYPYASLVAKLQEMGR